MGEFSDLVLEGVFCQVCGTFLGKAVGYPRTCAGCGGDIQEPDITEDDEEDDDGSEHLHPPATD